MKSVVLFHEDTIFGTDSSNAQKQMAEAAGIKVAADIRYRGNSPSLSAEVQQIKAANADVIMPSSYTSDAILLMRGMHEVGYTPKAIMAQSAGFAEQALIDAVGPLAEGVMSRSAFALDAAKARPAIPRGERAVQGAQQQGPERQHRARDHRADRAGRCDQPRRFDGAGEAACGAGGDGHAGRPDDHAVEGRQVRRTGQNIAATPVIQQIKDGKDHTIYPFDVAVRGSGVERGEVTPSPAERGKAGERWFPLPNPPAQPAPARGRGA